MTSPSPAPALPPGTPRLRPRDFARFQAFAEREAGIHLSPQKQALLVGRLARRLRELALPDYGAYLDRVLDDPAEKVRCLDLLTTNETQFFREPRHFELMGKVLLPRLAAEIGAGRRPRRVRVWSAACSSGEEPWSIAMTLLAAFPPGTGIEVEVLATDLSTRMLERARAGVYPFEKVRDIPQSLLRRFMLRGTGRAKGLVKVAPELRGVVTFDRLNLVDERWPEIGTFDLLFCRNVLMYFAPETRRVVVAHLLAHLAKDGVLFLGHAESLAGLGLPLHAFAPNVFVRDGSALAERGARRAGSAR